MNTMAKKWCFIVLALVMVLVGTASLAGCSSDDGEDKKPSYEEDKKPSYIVNFLVCFPDTQTYIWGESQVIPLGSTQKLKKNSFTYAGYVFDSWNTKADGSGTRYNNEEEVCNLADTAGATVVLYAQWRPIQYNITFDANGGQGSMPEQSFTYNEKKALSNNQFTKADYAFFGWNTKADGSGTTYKNKSTVKNLTTTNGATITLYAQWTAIKAITITMADAKDLTLVSHGFYSITLTGEYNDLSMQYLTQKIKAPYDAKIFLDMSAVTGDITISNMSGNTNLVSVVLPDVLKAVPDDAFRNCTSLETVTIGNQVTTIGQGAFSHCNFQEITLPDSVTTIGQDAFSRCGCLTGITIPDNVKDIHAGRGGNGGYDGTFGGCTVLKKIIIGKSISSISYDDFDGCTSLETITISESNWTYKSNDNMIYSKDESKLVFCPRAKTDQVVIPDTITEISAHAFSGCTNITTIEIPASVTRIGAYAFSGCTNLKTAYFAVPTGWSVPTRWSSAGIKLTLTDAEQNAQYLTGKNTTNYTNYTWTRTK